MGAVPYVVPSYRMSGFFCPIIHLSKELIII